MLHLSLVVPAWNEAARLPRLLDSIDAAASRWRAEGAGADALEVIVADNDSTDATAAVAAERGCRVVAVQKRMIAAARNGGAAVANGELLAFVDADSELHPDSFVRLSAAMADARAIGGASGVTMERWSLGIGLTYALMLPMVWLSGFDTGLVFLRRGDFVALAGFDEDRHAAEDIEFLWRLHRHARSSGRHLVRLRGVKAVTSSRKFDRHGDWHMFAQMPGLLWRRLRDRDAFSTFARGYWYEDR